MTDTLKIQTWNCLLHSNNSIYHHYDEQYLFNRLMFADNEIDNEKVQFAKLMFYFAINELIDPVYIKYRNYEYSLHPGNTRVLGKSFNNYFNPISCIVYSDANKKLLPITGLEVLNKIEIIDFPVEEWNNIPYLETKYSVRYSKKIDSHAQTLHGFWADHTQDLYRIFFEDRHLLIYPNKNNLEFNKRIEVNIEDFSGFREAIRYVFKCIKND